MTVAPRWRRVLTAFAAVAVGLLVLEGVSSVVLFLRDAPRRVQAPISERLHSEHDPDLGWRHRPGLSHRDMYGPGRTLTINAQGLRAQREYGPRASGAPRRVVCVGDSFTLGYGVDDAQTWPAQLERALSGWEALNMGQGGYGIDQAWLWYRRDSAAIEHELVLFAFIADDFRRMRTATFLGYSKPLLRWRDGALELTRVPVPSAAYQRPFLTQNLPLLSELRSVALALRLAGRNATLARVDQLLLDELEAERVAAAIFAEFARAAKSSGRRAALVALPSLDPRDPNRLASMPPALLRACESAETSGLEWIDLHGAFEALDAQTRRELFLLDAEFADLGARGHYSPRGNEFVAARLAAELDQAGLLGAGGVR